MRRWRTPACRVQGPSPRNTRCDVPSTVGCGPRASSPTRTRRRHGRARADCTVSACSRTLRVGAVELEQQRRLRFEAVSFE
jgi:hypothetical protein